MYSVKKTKQTGIADRGKPELTQNDQAGDLPFKCIIDHPLFPLKLTVISQLTLCRHRSCWKWAFQRDLKSRCRLGVPLSVYRL